MNQNLNPKIWQNNSLKPEVKSKLLEIAGTYWRWLKIPQKPTDIILTGSQANFNYTDNSDLDLHLVIDYNEINCDLDVAEFLKTKRDLWRELHDISIYDIPVELYTEDSQEKNVGARYSIIKNQWLIKPVKNYNLPDQDNIDKLTKMWLKIIQSSLNTDNPKACEQTRNLISQFRKLSLHRYGEFSAGNLAFKKLRDQGIIARLIKSCRAKSDQELGLQD